jgi:hypothetical protein
MFRFGADSGVWRRRSRQVAANFTLSRRQIGRGFARRYLAMQFIVAGGGSNAAAPILLAARATLPGKVGKMES